MDLIIEKLLEVKNGTPGKKVKLSLSEIKYICKEVTEILLHQPILLDLEAPLNIVGDIHG